MKKIVLAVTVAATMSAGTAYAACSAAIDMGNNAITNLANPTNSQDAATKAYVDAAKISFSMPTFIGNQIPAADSTALNLVDAAKYCRTQGGRLPTVTELRRTIGHLTDTTNGTNQYAWATNDMNTIHELVYRVNIENGSTVSADGTVNNKTNNTAFCVEDDSVKAVAAVSSGTTMNFPTAAAACADEGKRLPTITELLNAYATGTVSDPATGTHYWTSSFDDDTFQYGNNQDSIGLLVSEGELRNISINDSSNVEVVCIES